ncbi:MAG TPA: ABC transporter permease [Trebonia sp.]|nr:ABC transporter permease [Trebonia sp.]
MMWLAWRLARVPLAVGLAVVAAVALGAVAADRTDGPARLWLSTVVVVVPGLLGMFWGAPLVADELQAGTFRLAWTQDVSRVRWLALRLAVPALASLAVAGVVSWIVTWWAGPLDRMGVDQFGSFDARGVVPVGYAAFAFALGVLAGALTRRTVPAMAVTLAGFISVRVVVRLLVRPHLLPPMTRAVALNPLTTGYGSGGLWPFIPAPSVQPAPPDLPNSWITAIGIVNRSGTGLTNGQLARTCPGVSHARAAGAAPAGDSGHIPVPQSQANAWHECLARVATSYHEVVAYQPASRYWPLQWYELGLFLAAALLLAGACAWRVRRIG